MKYILTINRGEITLDSARGTITGATYGAKNWIKDEFPGAKWDGSRKAWIVDGTAIDEDMAKYHDYYVRVNRLQVVEEQIDEPVVETTEEAVETAAEATAEPVVETAAMMPVREAAEAVYTNYATTDNIWSKVGDSLHTQLVAGVRKHIDETILPAFASALRKHEPTNVAEWQLVAAYVDGALKDANKQVREVFSAILRQLERLLVERMD